MTNLPSAKRHFSHVTKNRIFKNLNLRKKALRQFPGKPFQARIGTWKFTTKEDLNPRKQVFFLNFRLYSAQKPKIWSIFYGKSFI